MWLLRLAFGLCGLVASKADITGTSPPLNTCICLDTNGVNVRDAACGNVIGSANIGDCYTFNGDQLVCDLSGTQYEYFHVDFDGISGWISGLYMGHGTDSACGTVNPVVDPEFRGLFVATASHIDWPDSSTETSAEQQTQMIEYLDMMVQMNMNALIFHVRPAADAFYASSYDPWSDDLTGIQGQAPDPFYDPLEFTITEAHNRGIEVYAWLNTYRGNLAPNYDGLDPSHICNTLTQYCYIYDNYLWLDPGVPEVVDYLVNVITEIVTNYDVDGINFDDDYYPFPGEEPFPDDATYQDYLDSGGSLSLDYWRRDNINTMISRVYATIRGLSNTVKFFVTPFGIYRPGEEYGMPSPITGFDPYSGQYCDAKLWLNSGWVDFLAPQIYWEIDPPEQSYPVILDWWLAENTIPRYVYAANAVYKLTEQNWPASEIVNQVGISRDTTRRDAGSMGNIHYSAQHFESNVNGIYDEFLLLYSTPASTPPMPWLGLEEPAEPIVQAQGNYISWQAADDITHTFTLYKKTGRDWIIVKKLPKTAVGFEVEEAGTYALRAANGANEFSDFVRVHVVSPKGKA